MQALEKTNGWPVAAPDFEGGFDPFGVGHGCNSVSAGLGKTMLLLFPFSAEDILLLLLQLFFKIHHGRLLWGSAFLFYNLILFTNYFIKKLPANRNGHCPRFEGEA